MTITREVQARHHPDAGDWELLEPVTFRLPSSDEITAPRGFRTDGASVPRWLWWLFPPIGTYFAAATIHDWLYRNGGAVDFPPFRLTQAACDRVFLLACEACGTGYIARRLMYYAVCLFGERSFRGIGQ